MAEGNTIKGLAVAAIAVLVVAAIVLTSIAIVNGYSKVLRTSTTTVNVTTTLLNGTPVDVGTTGQYPYLQSATGCVNNTASAESLVASKYSVTEGDSDGGTITLNSGESTWNGTAVNCTIVNLADSTAQASADDFLTGIGYFGTFIGIIVLALIGWAIVRIFGKE